MANIRPNQLPAASSVNPSSAIIVDAGGPVEKATPLQVVDAGRPKASQSDAETGTDNEKLMTPLRVSQAIDALGVSRADLASIGGASLVGFQLDGAAIARTAQEKMADIVSAADFGVSAGNSASGNTAALQAAIDYARANACTLELPAGEILLDGDVTIAAADGASGFSDHLFTMKGQGASRRKGTYLHFTSGSLIINAVHHVEGFFVTSDDADGVVVIPQYSPSKTPARASMRDVRAERCAGSGIVISDNWIYIMDNCFGRYNKGWGIEGRRGASFGISSNGWLILGGEFQGNGTKQGDNVPPNGSTERGTGGGILADGGIQITLVGSTIEGNVGDGLKLGEGVRGLALINVYFEKNGSHHTNCDICNDPPSSAVLGPSAVFILNSNFTPQTYDFDHSGVVQQRAIDLVGVRSLKIVNPQFFSSSASGSPSGYALPPIRVSETQNGICTGWVENPVMLWSGYGDTLTNETDRFGKPMVERFCPGLAMPEGADTASQRFYVPVSRQGGRRLDVAAFTRRATGAPLIEEARLTLAMSRGPSGTGFSNQARQVPYTTSPGTTATRVFSRNESLPSTETEQGSAELVVTRTGTHVDDTLSIPITLLGVEITVYEGVFSPEALTS